MYTKTISAPVSEAVNLPVPPEAGESFPEGAIGARRCSCCGAWKPIGSFYKLKHGRGGTQSQCKECMKKRTRQWTLENPGKARATANRWQRDNPDKARAAARRWYTENLDKARAGARRWREENPGKARAAVRRWQKKNPDKVRDAVKRWQKENPGKVRAAASRWQKENPDKARAITKRWREENPDKVLVLATRRRARLLGAAGYSYTKARHVHDRWSLWGGRCWVCGAPAVATDHVIALAVGGTNYPANLRPICKRCNSQKGARPVLGEARLARFPGPSRLP
jgi:5-methylcytosine-specific restriction endonuclease McrA